MSPYILRGPRLGNFSEKRLFRILRLSIERYVNFACLIAIHYWFIFKTELKPTWTSNDYFIFLHLIWNSMCLVTVQNWRTSWKKFDEYASSKMSSPKAEYAFIKNVSPKASIALSRAIWFISWQNGGSSKLYGASGSKPLVRYVHCLDILVSVWSHVRFELTENKFLCGGFRQKHMFHFYSRKFEWRWYCKVSCRWFHLCKWMASDASRLDTYLMGENYQRFHFSINSAYFIKKLWIRPNYLDLKWTILRAAYQPSTMYSYPASTNSDSSFG